jgi:hypothetical protein
MAQDKTSVYQNSGVRLRAVDDSEDDDDDMETDTYYGQIEEICLCMLSYLYPLSK